MEKQKKSVVVIPCYNEAQNIERLIPEIFCYDENMDVLIVDDSSEDNTKEVVEKLQEKYKDKVFIINRTGERSFGLSYVEGFKWSLVKDYDLIFQMDGDFSHHPKYLPVLLSQMGGYDLTIGSRYCEKIFSTKEWNNRRLIFSVLANFYAKTITRLPMKDVTGGFKCFKRSVLEAIDLSTISAKGFAFQMEMNWLVYRAGFKIKEMPIIFFSREKGKSKLSLNKIVEGLWIPLKIFFNNLHYKNHVSER